MDANIDVSDGVQKRILQTGKGPIPKVGQKITVHCTGFLKNPPKKFWSTRDPDQTTFSFNVGLKKVIAGWDEGCMTMGLGERAVLTIRSDKGYGKAGFPAWGPNADLEFDIEILSIG